MALEFFKFGFLKTVKSPEQRKAWFVAILADAIQIVGMPLFVEGGVSPIDTALDVAVGAILIKLLGWHWAFLPTFAAELVPTTRKRNQIGCGHPSRKSSGPAQLPLPGRKRLRKVPDIAL
jgi:hypothetical protein